MKKKKIIILICIVIVILAGILLMINKENKQELLLRNEISKLSQKDITTDNYNLKTVTTGDYAKVEKVIKQYYKEYSENIKTVFEILKNENLKQILSAQNYKQDGPEFKATKTLLQESKQTLNTSLENLTKMSDEDNIMKRIKQQNLDTYYENLYKDLMLSGVSTQTFEQTKKNYEETSTKINKQLTTYEEIINLLADNKDKWSIKDDKIQFKDSDTLNKYNELVKKI